MSDFYGGVSIDIWKKRLAVGANFGFLFGNIKHEQVVIMSGEGTGAYNTNRNQELRVRDLKMDFGLQYHTSVKQDGECDVRSCFFS